MPSELAIKGGSPVRTEPFTRWPYHDDRERELLLEVLESGVWSFGGPKEAEFSERFAEFCGASRALCVANGSVSLEIALRALGVGPGDEVIVPALTWTATAWAVVQVGAAPVFADIREEDWCIDPVDIREKITPQTRALIPVHLYNQIAEMDDILALAREHSLWVIEDCAHTHGSRWGDQGIGTLGDVGSFSFQESKGITSGEGGALVTNNEELADRMCGLKNCGRPARPGLSATFGGNYRITDLQAALLLAQLERLPGQLETKSKNIALFRQKMTEAPGISMTPPKDKATRQGLYAVSLNFDPKLFAGIPLDIMVAALQAEGIPVVPPYEVVYSSSLWVNGKSLLKFEEGADADTRLGLRASCPVAEKVSRRTGLTLPHQVFLGTEKDMEDVAAAFRKVQSQASELRTMGIEKKMRAKVRAVLKSAGLQP